MTWGARGRTYEAEFTDFVAARQSHLRRIALAVCRDEQRADDVLQIALTKLYLAWPRVRRDGSEEAYARRIIVRTDIDERRRPWRRERAGLDGHDPAATERLSIDSKLTLYEAVRSLPDMQRRVVLLRHWLALSVRETAADLQISEGTVKSHTSRALASLRDHLDDSAGTGLSDTPESSPAATAASAERPSPRAVTRPVNVT